MKCIYCNKETKNPKFCCRSCAQSFNNKIFPKRKPKIRYCKKCNNILESYWYKRRTVCNECLKPDKFTKGDYTKKRKYQIHSYIRDKARKKYKISDKPKKCVNCGYGKHYEVCHIKAIKHFDDTELIDTINDLNNLIALCPNCHWEFDNGLLDLSTIQDSNL